MVYTKIDPVHCTLGTVYRVQYSGYSVQGTVYRVQCTESSVQSTEYRVQSTEYRVQSTEYRVQCTGYSVQGTGYSVQGTVNRVQCTESNSYNISKKIWFLNILYTVFKIDLVSWETGFYPFYCNQILPHFFIYIKSFCSPSFKNLKKSKLSKIEIGHRK